MKGFKVPRKFWKAVLRVENGRLHATALVADQSPLIDFRLPEMLEMSLDEAQRFSFDKVAKYQVSVKELERQTGLEFGASVRAADTFVPERVGAVENRVVNVEEVSIERRRGKRAPRRSKR
jgi:endonuclease G